MKTRSIVTRGNNIRFFFLFFLFLMIFFLEEVTVYKRKTKMKVRVSRFGVSGSGLRVNGFRSFAVRGFRFGISGSEFRGSRLLVCVFGFLVSHFGVWHSAFDVFGVSC